MRILTWNINGLRSNQKEIGTLLDELDADIICLQETKLTRDQLPEQLALPDGYNSYFSFSRKRTGYSGVATYCKDSMTPVAAQEGLAGIHGKNCEMLDYYGDIYSTFEEPLLKELDAEGRAVITLHQIKAGQPGFLALINVYCPRVDPEKPERAEFKLRFLKLLEMRTKALLEAHYHVVVLGDVNISHKMIDHCDPTNSEEFESSPSRQWLSQFLHDGGEDDSKGTLVDSFRYFHPDRKSAFTCWNTKASARALNYGTRIDYILVDPKLLKSAVESCDIQPSVQGSDHCPVVCNCRCQIDACSKPPDLCTKYYPEYSGKQQKLSNFFVKKEKTVEDEVPAQNGESRAKRKDGGFTWTKPVKKKGKVEANSGSILSFFKKNGTESSSSGENNTELQKDTNGMGPSESESSSSLKSEERKDENNGFQEKGKSKPSGWAFMMNGPKPPPKCKGHDEACVLRTVKKKGPNFNRQFYSCPRGEGKSTDLEARCDFFKWAK